MRAISYRAGLFGAAALSLAMPSGACAQTAEPWRFQVTPYVWAVGVQGSVDPGEPAPAGSFERSFGDILDNLDAAFFLTGTARHGRVVLAGDMSYASVSETHDVRIPFAGVTLPVDASLRQFSATLLAGYSVVETPHTVLDLLAGARAYDVTAEVNLPAPLGPLPQTLSESRGWVDPILAVRLRHDFAPRWSVIAYGDVGGFQIGSELTWQSFATINFQLTPSVYLSAGYRTQSIDYDRRGLNIDVDMSGPIIGTTFRF